jgi:riboflavin kinase/FMN adenylyltransferase
MAEAGPRFRGRVRQGRGRGRTLGFPTLNLELDRAQVQNLPQGVYAAQIAWEGQPPMGALANIGMRPTFGERELSIEVHVLDFAGDLYGQEVEVALLGRLRDEREFPNVQALVEQIKIDCQQARALLAQNGARP